MGLVAYVTVYKHFSSVVQNIHIWNFGHLILFKTIWCWVSEESFCHADAEYVLQKATDDIYITEPNKNYLLKYLMQLIWLGICRVIVKKKYRR